MRKELTEHNLGWRSGKRLMTEVEKGEQKSQAGSPGLVTSPTCVRKQSIHGGTDHRGLWKPPTEGHLGLSSSPSSCYR